MFVLKFTDLMKKANDFFNCSYNSKDLRMLLFFDSAAINKFAQSIFFNNVVDFERDKGTYTVTKNIPVTSIKSLNFVIDGGIFCNNFINFSLYLEIFKNCINCFPCLKHFKFSFVNVDEVSLFDSRKIEIISDNILEILLNNKNIDTFTFYNESQCGFFNSDSVRNIKSCYFLCENDKLTDALIKKMKNKEQERFVFGFNAQKNKFFSYNTKEKEDALVYLAKPENDDDLCYRLCERYPLKMKSKNRMQQQINMLTNKKNENTENILTIYNIKNLNYCSTYKEIPILTQLFSNIEHINLSFNKVLCTIVDYLFLEEIINFKNLSSIDILSKSDYINYFGKGESYGASSSLFNNIFTVNEKDMKTFMEVIRKLAVHADIKDGLNLIVSRKILGDRFERDILLAYEADFNKFKYENPRVLNFINKHLFMVNFNSCNKNATDYWSVDYWKVDGWNGFFEKLNSLNSLIKTTILSFFCFVDKCARTKFQDFAVFQHILEYALPHLQAVNAMNYYFRINGSHKKSILEESIDKSMKEYLEKDKQISKLNYEIKGALKCFMDVILKRVDMLYNCKDIKGLFIDYSKSLKIKFMLIFNSCMEGMGKNDKMNDLRKNILQNTTLMLYIHLKFERIINKILRIDQLLDQPLRINERFIELYKKFMNSSNVKKNISEAYSLFDFYFRDFIKSHKKFISKGYKQDLDYLAYGRGNEELNECINLVNNIHQQINVPHFTLTTESMLHSDYQDIFKKFKNASQCFLKILQEYRDQVNNYNEYIKQSNSLNNNVNSSLNQNYLFNREQLEISYAKCIDAAKYFSRKDKLCKLEDEERNAFIKYFNAKLAYVLNNKDKLHSKVQQIFKEDGEENLWHDANTITIDVSEDTESTTTTSKQSNKRRKGGADN